MLFPYLIKTYYVYFYCIFIRWYHSGMTSIIFFHAHFTSFHTHASLLTFFSFFVLFYSCCSNAWVFGKTLVHEFHISYSHTEWYLLFLQNEMI